MPGRCWGAQLGSHFPLGEPEWAAHQLELQVSIVFLVEGAGLGVACPPLLPLA